MSRRYLNMIVKDFSGRTYSLRRIDVRKHLFYRDSEAAQQQAARDASGTKKKRGTSMGRWKNLPPPAINFQPTPSSMNSWVSYFFSSLGGGENDILYSDPRGQTTLYNIHSNCFEDIPCPSSPKTPLEVIYIPVPQGYHADPMKPQSHYFFNMLPASIASCFEVLSHRREEGWRWDALPPPPFFTDQKTFPGTYSYAVVDGSTICLSPSVAPEQGIGTYTFDTMTSNWRLSADWVLPLFGKAEYVPELNLWFGLLDSNPFSRLCAVDLSSAMDSSHPPVPLHTWDYLDLPEDKPWLPTHVHLLNLGSGKFCVATLFGTLIRNWSYSYSDEEDMDGEQYAVFTGLEVKRSNSADGPLQLIKHKSRRYDVGSCGIYCVL